MNYEEKSKNYYSNINDLKNYLYDAEDYVRCEINSLDY